MPVMETIKLESKDGEIIEANISVVKQSAVLQKKLEEQVAAGNDGKALRITEADGSSLRLILHWLDHYRKQDKPEDAEQDSEESQIPNNQEQNAKRQGAVEMDDAWNAELFQTFQHLFVLVAVANRLKLQGLVDAIVRFVSARGKGKSINEFREMVENGMHEVRASKAKGKIRDT